RSPGAGGRAGGAVRWGGGTARAGGGFDDGGGCSDRAVFRFPALARLRRDQTRGRVRGRGWGVADRAMTAATLLFTLLLEHDQACDSRPWPLHGFYSGLACWNTIGSDEPIRTILTIAASS